jgi:hypothetical protein
VNDEPVQGRIQPFFRMFKDRKLSVFQGTALLSKEEKVLCCTQSLREFLLHLQLAYDGPQELK